jgi:hypothetical protein
MNISEVLKNTGFESALIMDDAFDAVPTAADLSMDPQAWSIFIADIAPDLELVEGAFPEYQSMNATALRESDEFVQAMYGLKDRLRPELWNTLFEGYERDRASDLTFLEKLRERLSAAGLTVKTVGRAGAGEAKDCQIIFADLFLGAAQQDFDVDKSIARLGKLIAGRESKPPAVVLMSRSTRLQDKKEKFRDEAKMVGALFRVYLKPDLLAGSTIETVLERLATSHADAIRVAAFLAEWEAGLTGARNEFMRLIRRLDLSDYSRSGSCCSMPKDSRSAVTCSTCLIACFSMRSKATSRRLPPPRRSMPSIRPVIPRPISEVRPISKIWLSECCGRTRSGCR